MGIARRRVSLREDLHIARARSIANVDRIREDHGIDAASRHFRANPRLAILPDRL